jgi:hypothetical protein
MPRQYQYVCPLCEQLKHDSSDFNDADLSSSVCGTCSTNHKKLEELYQEIVRRKPRHSHLSIDQLFRKLWQHVLSTEVKNQ